VAPPRTDDFSAKIMQPIIGFVRHKLGDAALTRLVETAECTPQDLEITSWIPLEKCERLLGAAFELLGNEERFLEACAYKMKEGYGPILWVLRTTSPQATYRLMARTLHFVSHVSHFEMLESSSNSARIRYITTRKESRLMCLSRQAFLRTLPNAWRMPEAAIVEHACVGKGDAVCEYTLRWYEPTRMWPVLLGTGVGVGLAWASTMVHMLTGAEFITFPLLGCAFGLLYETRRAGRNNLAFADDTQRALEALGEEYQAGMHGLLELHQRQHEWNHVLEERMAERQQALDTMVERVDQLNETRNTTLLSLSHDMKSPLAVVRANNAALREHVKDDGEALEALEDNEYALKKADTILRELLTVTKDEAGIFEVRPEPIGIAALLERIRGTAKALVMGRDIRVSVFATRLAPELVETDPFLLNRIIDNILTNAAKYTERGSIVVECDGTPLGLCLKVTDSGRGIPEERLRRVFTAREADASPVTGDSHGLGLPIVVRLLDQLGGTLEVFSKLSQGTTFWINLPLRQNGLVKAPNEPIEAILDRVVTIKRVANHNQGS
jgi:signal transduction histidine kinase